MAEEILDVVERYADGAAARSEFLAARKAIRTALKDKTKDPAILAMKCLGGDSMEGMTVTVVHARRRNAAAQCGLIRCVCGHPYRPEAFDTTWFTSTVVALAKGIYDERAFNRLPLLADALEEAGCEDARVLGHCRGQELHTRGCWVLDGLLLRG